MKYWMVCIGSVLTLLMMGQSLVLAGESGNSVSLEKRGSQAPIVQHKSQEDCTSISLNELVERLKASKAIGFFTKLAIRSDVLNFQDEVIQMRKKKLLKAQMLNIKASFDGLLLKIMALLEKDPDLAKNIYSARDSIFQSLLEVKT